MRHALILAGGSGTRLWPYSTATRPKQLVPLLDGRSLLDLAVERARAAAGPDNVWLCAGASMREPVLATGAIESRQIVVEPSARDTLAAIALGCAAIAAADPDAVVAVLTADHVIEPVAALAATVDAAFDIAGERTLVTFGVPPERPETGYGYLELGASVGPARRVARFREKPDAATAREFLDHGPDRYLWNSGMFVWRAATFLRAVDTFAPHVAAAVRDLAQWDALPKLSVDYGVMEPASESAGFDVVALPLRTRWLDVGSWPAYGDAVGRDADGNALAPGSLAVAARGCVVATAEPGHLVAVVGCTDLVVVHTPDATLVVTADRAQDVKALQALIARERPDLA